jgi:hypothetical protein
MGRGDFARASAKSPCPHFDGRRGAADLESPVPISGDECSICEDLGRWLERRRMTWFASPRRQRLAPAIHHSLPGGSTPRKLHTLLADRRSRIATASTGRCGILWGDERHAPPDHSTATTEWRARRCRSRPHSTGPDHRIRAELPDADAAAEDYERELRALVGDIPFPRFDPQPARHGTDGPRLRSSAPPVHERALAIAPWVDKLRTFRSRCRRRRSRVLHVIFMVTGRQSGRAEAGAEGPRGPIDCRRRSWRRRQIVV